MEVVKAYQYHPNGIQKGQIICFNENLRGIGCSDCIDREACMREIMTLEILSQQKSKERMDKVFGTVDLITRYRGEYVELYDLALEIVRNYNEKKERGQENDRKKNNK